MVQPMAYYRPFGAKLLYSNAELLQIDPEE